MMTPKELLQELLKVDGKPDRQLKQYEAFHMALGDPVSRYLTEGIHPGAVNVINRWGVTISWPEGEAGSMPVINDETKVLKDITRWREQVKAPDLTQVDDSGWEEFRAAAHEAAGEDKLVTCFMPTGIFEQCHFLMGFEDTLENLYEHPQEMHELIDYITDFRIEQANRMIEGMQPEVVLSHDDWGAKEALFMKPDMWREFFKEPYRRFYQNFRDKGVIVMHHADSYLVPILEDMIELGIQIWQGTLPENDIPAIQKSIAGRMVLMGGIGAAIDRPDSTEEEITSYVDAALAEYCPGGHYIPCITYGIPGSVYPHVSPVVDQEIERYNQAPHLPNFRVSQRHSRLNKINLTRSAASASTAAGDQASGSAEILTKIASALQKGQKKKVLKLVEEALDQGLEAQTILTSGLVQGMAELGDDFSAGRVFVPEMLMAARCMTAATDILKPHLTAAAGATGSAGRIALGTVKGDMHDIGKNLVKIMMEGNGLDVVDLGVDVDAERFVEAAKEQNCNIIACSAMLTTSMNEMQTVVDAAVAAGIRDQVKILIGGAPITQEFCDQIQADCYTDDAAQAAVAAAGLWK